MSETLDTVFAKCQQLSDEDLGILLSAIQHEQEERECREKKAAWHRVVNALIDYTQEYGSVVIADNEDGTGIVLRGNLWTYGTLGVIDVG